MKGIFKRGYGALEEEQARSKKFKEQIGKKLFSFFLTEQSDEADIRFLTEDPLTCYVHRLQETRNGKLTYSTYVCPRNGGENPNEECYDCNNTGRASFGAAYLIIDKRPYTYKDKDGKEVTRESSIKVYICGVSVAGQISRLSKKHGLTNRDYTISRTGSGAGKVDYQFDRGEQYKLSTKEIENLLPEKLRDMYDGTAESLYEILGIQLDYLLRDTQESGGSDDNYEDEKEDKKSKSSRDVFRHLEDDEDEEEKPKSKFKSKFKAK